LPGRFFVFGRFFAFFIVSAAHEGGFSQALRAAAAEKAPIGPGFGLHGLWP
jgi:hypothetical protein